MKSTKVFLLICIAGILIIFANSAVADGIAISSSSSASSGINFGNQASPPADNITPAVITSAAGLLGVVLTILATKCVRSRRR
jgi:hypothetical protein